MRLQSIREVARNSSAHHGVKAPPVYPLRGQCLLEIVADLGPEPFHVETENADRGPIHFHDNTDFAGGSFSFHRSIVPLSNWVTQNSDAFDFHFHNVAMLHRPRFGRCSSIDDVAGE